MKANYNIVVDFALQRHVSATGAHVSPAWAPPSSRPIPLGCPRAPALGAQLHTSNLHWSSTLHMVVYMFQYHSLLLSHLCLLLHNPKVCSLHLCLFCCLAYRVTVTVFLNSIYIGVHILYWCFSFLTYFSLYNRLQFHHLFRTDSNAFFFIAE